MADGQDGDSESGHLITLTVYYSVMEAKIAVSMLQSYGIYAFAPTELANNAPQMMSALGGIPIMVVDSDYAAAKALLDDVRETEPAPPPKPFRKRIVDGLVGLGVLALFGLPPAPSPPPTGERPDEPEA